MFIVAVLCWCAALVLAGSGIWLLARQPADPTQSVLRGVAPTQLAAAAMLASGGTAALSSHPDTALIVVVVCVIGAVGTVAAGCWQAAKVLASRQTSGPAAVGGCGNACATCTLSCG